MQMIDVLKRLAELDATNPNVVPAKKLVKESFGVASLAPMGGMEKPAIPASMNITAGSGEEISNMLATIMQLAGVHKVEPEHLGAEPRPSTLTAEPSMSAGPQSADGEQDSMRSVLDKMHDIGDDDGKEETDEGEEPGQYGIPDVSNTPNNPTTPPPFDPNEYSQNSNDGDGASSNGKRRTGMQPTATFESLMDDYKKFVAEGNIDEGSYNPDRWAAADMRRGQDASNSFRDQERSAGLEDETNNYAVVIDGRTWKVFSDQRQAQNIARSLQAKGKNAAVQLTAANPSEGMMEAKADPTGSWVVYDSTDTAKFKRFKTREGAKAYAEKSGGTVASSEHYHDTIKKKDGLAGK